MGVPCYIIGMIKTLPLLNLKFLPAIANVPCRRWPKTLLLSTYLAGLLRNIVLRGGGGGSPIGQKMSVTQNVLKRIDNFVFVNNLVSIVSFCFIGIPRLVVALKGASSRQIVAGYPLSARSSEDEVVKIAVRDSIIRHSNFLYSKLRVRGVGSRWVGCTHKVNRGLTVRELVSKELFVSLAEGLIFIGLLGFLQSLSLVAQGLRFRLRGALLVGLTFAPREDTFIAKVNCFRVAVDVSEQGFKAVALRVNALVKSNCFLWIASVRRKFFDGFGQSFKVAEVQTSPTQRTEGHRYCTGIDVAQRGCGIVQFVANCNQFYAKKKAPDKASEAKGDKDKG